MSDKVLVTYSSNWADEINIGGKKVLTKNDWDNICQEVKKIFEKTHVLTHHVGTNEDIEYYSYKDWLSDYKIVEITTGESIILEKYQCYVDICHFFEPAYYPEDYEN